MINDRFTKHYQTTIENAYRLANNDTGTVDIFHLLNALKNQEGSLGAELLKTSKIKIEDTDTEKKSKKNNDVRFSDEVLSIIQKSVLIAYRMRHPYIGTEHLVASLLEHQLIKKYIKAQDIKKLRIQSQAALKSTSRFIELTDTFEPKSTQNSSSDDIEEMPEQPTLAQFVTDLTDPIVQKKIDPVIGREKEIDRLMNILGRRHKNNPILLGDPGVGKTAIVEGLAKKIMLQEVPDFLIDKKIFRLDLTALIAGTMYRGDFEARLKSILDEVKENPQIIIFIDEIHTIMGAGSSAGSMDAANILKPALARDTIRCIGATTFDEYKKHIETDPALERRFQTISINEPNQIESVEIIKGLKSSYELFHHVRISDSIIENAVKLAKRYITHHKLPDTAIDLLDETAARNALKQNNSGILKKIKTVKDTIDSITKEKHKQILNEAYEKAIALKTSELEYNDNLKKLNNEYNEIRKSTQSEITIDDVLQTLSVKTKIPIKNLTENEYRQLTKLETKLANKVIGQNHILKQICDQIRKAKLGVQNPNRPIGSFIFAGTSGVGKTHLAKTIAEILFDDPQKLIRINMAELGESFSSSSLIGSPAGYVGYKDETLLTDKVKKNPSSVILFDEIEKAHPKIFNLLLSILDEGFLIDASGKRIDFRNTLIIMTTNISDEIMNTSKIGFENTLTSKTKKEECPIHEHINRILGQEIINRIDKICIFKTLDFPDLKKIAKLHVDELVNRLKDHKVTIKINTNAINLIVKKSLEQKKGARMLRSTIEEKIEQPLVNVLITKKKKRKKTEHLILIHEKKGELIFS